MSKNSWQEGRKRIPNDIKELSSLLSAKKHNKRKTPQTVIDRLGDRNSNGQQKEGAMKLRLHDGGAGCSCAEKRN